MDSEIAKQIEVIIEILTGEAARGKSTYGFGNCSGRDASKRALQYCADLLTLCAKQL